mmetsp:Transcript_13475/g.19426  ORF Transcript_13475/g.19426 Transcript_13475/m.19426 type:complete len:200 (+) Transcript_13475:950-1549(+)
MAVKPRRSRRARVHNARATTGIAWRPLAGKVSDESFHEMASSMITLYSRTTPCLPIPKCPLSERVAYISGAPTRQGSPTRRRLYGTSGDTAGMKSTALRKKLIRSTNGPIPTTKHTVRKCFLLVKKLGTRNSSSGVFALSGVSVNQLNGSANLFTRNRPISMPTKLHTSTSRTHLSHQHSLKLGRTDLTDSSISSKMML